MLGGDFYAYLLSALRFMQMGQQYNQFAMKQNQG